MGVFMAVVFIVSILASTHLFLSMNMKPFRMRLETTIDPIWVNLLVFDFSLAIFCTLVC